MSSACDRAGASGGVAALVPGRGRNLLRRGVGTVPRTEVRADERCSYVGKKAEPRWFWHALDHHRGTVLAPCLWAAEGGSLSAEHGINSS